MIAVLLALAITASPDPAPASPDRVPVITLPDETGPEWAELRVALPGGSSADPRRKSGLAHVASLLLERRLGALGARVHLGRHGIAISAGAPSDNAEAVALELIDAVAREATSVELDAAVRVASERRRRFADDDRALAEMELLRAIGSREHALGAVEELATITRDDVATLQRTNWTAAQIRFVIAGRFDPALEEKLAERLAKLERPAPKKEPAARPEPAPRPGGLRVTLIDKPNRRQAYLAIGRNLDSIDAARVAANAGLGGSMSGRLTKAMLRAPAVGGYAFSALRDEELVVWSAVKTEQTTAAIARILETLAEVAKKGLDGDELLLGRRASAAQVELMQRDAASRADAAVRAHLSPIDRDLTGAILIELSDDAVRRASQALAKSDGLSIVVVASVTRELQSALVAIPGVAEVQVARYDLR